MRKIITVLICCILPMFAHTAQQPTYTGSASLTWVAPTKNTDGSPLTNLSGYTIHYGNSSSTLNQTVSVTNPSITAYVVENLAPGTWYFGVKAVTPTATSGMSNIATKVITNPIPAAPTNLHVVELTAYQFIGTLDKVVLLPVGTVPSGTACKSDQSVNGHYVVPRSAVTWYGSVKPQVVFAKCSN